MKVADGAAFGSLEDFVVCTGKQTVIELKVCVFVFHGDGFVGQLYCFADCAQVVNVANCFYCAGTALEEHGDVDGICFSRGTGVDWVETPIEAEQMRQVVGVKCRDIL